MRFFIIYPAIELFTAKLDCRAKVHLCPSGWFKYHSSWWNPRSKDRATARWWPRPRFQPAFTLQPPTMERWEWHILPCKWWLVTSTSSKEHQWSSRCFQSAVSLLFYVWANLSAQYPCRLGEECQPESFTSPTPNEALFDPEKVVIVTNGRCASSCSLFSVCVIRFPARMIFWMCISR